MDNLIPFLILVAISIIGVATRKKKKRPFPGSIVEEEPGKRSDDFLGWMERFVDDEPAPKPYIEEEAPIKEVVVEEVAPESVAVEANKAYSHYNGFISPEEHEKLVNKESPHKKIKEDKSEHAKESIKDGEIGREPDSIDFDLKQAVIFSTILERKYD